MGLTSHDKDKNARKDQPEETLVDAKKPAQVEETETPVDEREAPADTPARSERGSRAERRAARAARAAERDEGDRDDDAPRGGRTERRDREERREEVREPREERNTESQPVELKRMQNVGLFRSTGASGRASSFLGTYNKFLKDNQADQQLADFQKHNIMMLLREFKSELVTFIALASNVGEKLYYNLIVVENKESIIQDRNRKSDRRERRRGRVDMDVRVYQALPDMLTDSILERINTYILDNTSGNLNVDDLVYTGYTTLSYNVPIESFDHIKPIMGSAYEANMEAAGVLDPLTNEFFKDEGIQLEGIISTAGSVAAVGFNGRPIRNDISISVETFCQNNDRNPLDNDKEGQQWATGAAYVDLVPGPCLWNDGADDRRHSKTKASACLTPRLVFSEVDIYQSEDRGPLIRMMAVIATAIELGKANRYLKPFMPRAFNASRDRELEALGYLMDPEGKVAPQRLDFENPSDDREAFNFLDSLIRHDKGLEIGMRFCEGQPGASIATIFQDIWEGNEDALDYLFDTLDEATGDRFSEEFDRLRGVDVIANVLDQPDGYYMSSNGPRPATDVDHAYAATLLRDTDVDRLDDFIDCNSTNSDMDYDERMTKFVELLQHLTQDTFKMTGIAQLYIFDPIFLTAVFNSFSKAKMALRVDRDRDEIRGRRGNRSGSSYGVQYDSVRGRDRSRDRDRDDRGRGSSRRRSAW